MKQVSEWWKRTWAAWCRLAGAEVEGRSGQGFTAIATADLNWLLGELNTLRARWDNLQPPVDGIPRLMSALDGWAKSSGVESSPLFLIEKLNQESVELMQAKTADARPMNKLSPRENSLIRDGLLKLEQSYRETAAQSSTEHLPLSNFADLAKEVADVRAKLQDTVLYLCGPEAEAV